MASRNTSLGFLDPLRRYNVETARSFLGVSRATIYKLIGDSRIATIKEGKRRWIPGSEIARLSAVPSPATSAQS
jgi:excisionase family DNA binding protein